MAQVAPMLIGGALGLFGSAISASNAPQVPQPPRLPELPRVEDMLDVIDKIAGVQSINVRGPDGKIRRVTERLPRSPEEEAIYQEAGRIMSAALNNIQELYKRDPNAVLNYAPFIETVNKLNQERGEDIAKLAQIPDFNAFANEFRDMERFAIDEQYRDIRNIRQNELAGMGYGLDSTAQANSMAAIEAEKEKALRGVDVRAKLAAQEYAEKDARNRIINYNLAEQGRSGQKQAMLDVLSAEQARLSERETHRQKQIAEQGGLLQASSAIRKEDVNTALSSHAPSLGLNLFNAQLNTNRAYAENQLMNYNNQLRSYAMQPMGIGEALGYGLSGMGGYMFSDPSGRFGQTFQNILNPPAKRI